MARARTELGPDAVILSNKKVGGKVELVAAVDLDEAAFEHNETLAQHRREQGVGAAPVEVVARTPEGTPEAIPGRAWARRGIAGCVVFGGGMVTIS